MSEIITKDENGNLIKTSTVPIGTILFGAGATTAPTGFLVCDGAEISRTAYPELFSVLGTVWGAGNGLTTFNLPDARNRFPRASAAGLGVGTTQEDAIRNITGSVSSTEYAFSGTANELVAGAITITEGGICHNGSTAFFSIATTGIYFDASKAPGVLTADENRPKSIVFSAYIKY